MTGYISKVIKTKKDHAQALGRVSFLMDKNEPLNAQESAELELLALLIETYEKSIIVSTDPDPVEAILFRMEQQNLSRKNLVPYFGSLSKVSEVLSRKRPLSLSMIKKLHQGLGISARLLLSNSQYNQEDLTKEAVDSTKFPFKDMWQRGYFSDFCEGTLQAAKKNQEALITQCINGLPSEYKIFCRANLAQNRIRNMDPYALQAWTARVFRKAQSCVPSVSYDKKSMTEEWLRYLAKLSCLRNGPCDAKDYLAQNGIILIIEEALPKTYLDGAAIFHRSQPIIALTLRHDRIDNFWFSLLHELVHLQKHLTSMSILRVDNFDDVEVSAEEQEANQIAANALIPKDQWKRFIADSTLTAKNIEVFASSLQIHPAIVAGRIRHERKNWKIFSQWFGQQCRVRHLFH